MLKVLLKSPVEMLLEENLCIYGILHLLGGLRGLLTNQNKMIGAVGEVIALGTGS